MTEEPGGLQSTVTESQTRLTLSFFFIVREEQGGRKIISHVTGVSVLSERKS